MALALYDSLAADAATAPADEAVAPAPVAPTEAATAAAEVISLTFCWIRNGIEADKPIGMPCSVYNAINKA